MIDQDNRTTAGDDNDSDRSRRRRAIEAYEGARGRASDTLGEAPLIALAGGIAAGALIAALLPRTETETRAVRPTARRIRDTAKAAVRAARDTGSQRLSERGIDRERGEQTIRNLFEGISEAARASAQAALSAARERE